MNPTYDAVPSDTPTTLYRGQRLFLKRDTDYAPAGTECGVVFAYDNGTPDHAEPWAKIHYRPADGSGTAFACVDYADLSLAPIVPETVAAPVPLSLTWSDTPTRSTAEHPLALFQATRVGRQWRVRITYADTGRCGEVRHSQHGSYSNAARFPSRDAAKRAALAELEWLKGCLEARERRAREAAEEEAAKRDHDMTVYFVFGTDPETGGRVVWDVLPTETGNPDHYTLDDIAAMYPGHEIEIQHRTERY
jgi:hypothetical protein